MMQPKTPLATRRRRLPTWPLALAVTGALLGGCADREAGAAKAEPMATGFVARPAEASATAEAPSVGQPEPLRPLQERKLIQNAELRLEVDGYAEARAALDALLRSADGFVATARVDHHDGEVSHASLTLRVPSARLRAFLADAAGHGTVTHERLDTQDVTDAYFDLKARLDNARRLEARLLELLAGKMDTMQSLLEVERELARVRETVERFEGTLARMDQQVALSTVQLDLTTRRTFAAAVQPSLGDRAEHTLLASVDTLGSAARAALLVVVAVIPWLLPFAILALLLRVVLARMASRRGRIQAGPHAA